MTYTFRSETDTVHLLETVKSVIEEYEQTKKSKFYCHEKVTEEGVLVITCHWTENDKQLEEMVELSNFTLSMDKDQMLLTYKLLSFS